MYLVTISPEKKGIMGRRRGFLKIKFKKKHLRKAGWLASVFAAGFLLFMIYQHHGRFWIHRIAPKLFKPSIVFVIDDIGGQDKYNALLEKLGPKVTYAVLPLLPYSSFFGKLGRQIGAEVILHLPLDTTHDMIPGRGLIVSTMTEEDILAMLDRDLKSVPNLVGVNNHMGSRGTTDRQMMTIILRELKKRKLFFLDSYTTKDSVVPEVARSVGLPFLQRGVFLDNVDKKDAILAEIRLLEKTARTKRSAVAIGHYRKNTLEVLAKEIPRLEAEGFEIISLKELLKIHRD